jgi:hypothetical protein
MFFVMPCLLATAPMATTSEVIGPSFLITARGRPTSGVAARLVCHYGQQAVAEHGLAADAACEP